MAQTDATEAWNHRPAPWVSCADRMPADGQKVLAVSASHRPHLMWYYDRGGWFPQYPHNEINHWLPMPEGPEVDNES